MEAESAAAPGVGGSDLTSSTSAASPLVLGEGMVNTNPVLNGRNDRSPSASAPASAHRQRRLSLESMEALRRIQELRESASIPISAITRRPSSSQLPRASALEGGSEEIARRQLVVPSDDAPAYGRAEDVTPGWRPARPVALPPAHATPPLPTSALRAPVASRVSSSARGSNSAASSSVRDDTLSATSSVSPVMEYVSDEEEPLFLTAVDTKGAARMHPTRNESSQCPLPVSESVVASLRDDGSSTSVAPSTTVELGLPSSLPSPTPSEHQTPVAHASGPSVAAVESSLGFPRTMLVAGAAGTKEADTGNRFALPTIVETHHEHVASGEIPTDTTHLAADLATEMPESEVTFRPDATAHPPAAADGTQEECVGAVSVALSLPTRRPPPPPRRYSWSSDDVEGGPLYSSRRLSASSLLSNSSSDDANRGASQKVDTTVAQGTRGLDSAAPVPFLAASHAQNCFTAQGEGRMWMQARALPQEAPLGPVTESSALAAAADKKSATAPLSAIGMPQLLGATRLTMCLHALLLRALARSFYRWRMVAASMKATEMAAAEVHEQLAATSMHSPAPSEPTSWNFMHGTVTPEAAVALAARVRRASVASSVEARDAPLVPEQGGVTDSAACTPPVPPQCHLPAEALALLVDVLSPAQLAALYFDASPTTGDLPEHGHAPMSITPHQQEACHSPIEQSAPSEQNNPSRALEMMYSPVTDVAAVAQRFEFMSSMTPPPPAPPSPAQLHHMLPTASSMRQERSRADAGTGTPDIASRPRSHDASIGRRAAALHTQTITRRSTQRSTSSEAHRGGNETENHTGSTFCRAGSSARGRSEATRSVPATGSAPLTLRASVELGTTPGMAAGIATPSRSSSLLRPTAASQAKHAALARPAVRERAEARAGMTSQQAPAPRAKSAPRHAPPLARHGDGQRTRPPSMSAALRRVDPSYGVRQPATRLVSLEAIAAATSDDLEVWSVASSLDHSALLSTEPRPDRVHRNTDVDAVPHVSVVRVENERRKRALEQERHLNEPHVVTVIAPDLLPAAAVSSADARARCTQSRDFPSVVAQNAEPASGIDTDMQAVVRLRLEEDARSPLRVAPLDALHRPLPPSYRRRQHWIAATSTLASSAAAAPLNESLRGYGTPRSVSPRLRLEGGDTRPLDARLASSVRSGRSTQLVSSRAGAARHREDSQSDLHAREARHVARVLMGASPAAASGASLATSSIVPLAPRGIAAAVVGHAGSLVHEDAAIHTSAAVMPHVGEGRRPHSSALIAALQPLQVDDDYMSPPPSSSSTPLERHVYVVPTLSQADRAAIDAAAAAAVVRAEATRTSLQSALSASSSRTPSPRASTRGRGASAASYKRIVSGSPAARTVLASRATPLLVQHAAAHTSALLLQETTAADTIRRIGSVTLRQVTQSARVTEPTVLLTSSNM